MLREWSAEYVIGIDPIDAQHEAFFAAAHALHERILDCEGEKIVEDSVAFLRDYAAQHFAAEEMFMQQHGFPGLERHKKLHERFFDGLDMLLHDLKVFGPSQHLADQALEIAQDWLLEHIIDEDAQYAAFVREKARGG